MAAQELGLCSVHPYFTQQPWSNFPISSPCSPTPVPPHEPSLITQKYIFYEHKRSFQSPRPVPGPHLYHSQPRPSRPPAHLVPGTQQSVNKWHLTESLRSPEPPDPSQRVCHASQAGEGSGVFLLQKLLVKTEGQGTEGADTWADSVLQRCFIYLAM